MTKIKINQQIKLCRKQVVLKVKKIAKGERY